MLTNVLLLLALLFVTFSALAGWSWIGRTQRSVRLDWLEAFFLAIVSIVILTGSIATLLGQLGRFSVMNLALILLGAGVVAMALIWRRWRQGQHWLAFRRMAWQEYVLLLLLAVCVIVYFRPHEYVFGGTDAGSYMNIGASLVRTGAFVESGSWVDLLAEHGDTTMRQLPPPSRPSQLQFMGWYVDDVPEILPQFLPFHSALLAVAIGASNTMGGLLLVSLWGVLDIAALYLLSRRLFGSTVALLAALFLAVTPTQIFFARYPTTEPLTLLLLFAGLLAFQMLWDKESQHRIWGIFGGAALGAAMLTRIDLPVVFAIVVAALAWRLWQGQWHHGWTAYVVTLLLFLLHLAWIIQQMNWPYALNTYGAVIRYIDWRLVLLIGGIGLLLAVILLFVQRRSLDRADLPASLIRWLESSPVRWSLIILVVSLSLFAYFIYPVVAPGGTATAWPGNVDFPVLNGENWVRIGWYVTPLGLILATLGLSVILRREPLGRLAVFLLIGVLTTVQYVYNIFNTPYHIYAMRRYVPIVLPMLMIYAGYATVALYRMRPPVIMRTAAALAGAALVLAMLYQGTDIAKQRDYAGSVDQLAELNAQLHPDAILVIAETPEGLFADALGVPLHHRFGHDVLTLRQEDGRIAEVLKRALSYAEAENRPLQLITTEPVFSSVRQNLQLQPVAMVQLATTMLQNTFVGFPSEIQQVDYGVEIYDVMDNRSSLDHVSNPEEPGDNEIVIDVGTLDSIYLDEGFYNKEIIPGAASMRWTAGEAVVTFPALPSEQVELKIDAMRYRPEGVAAAPVEIWLDDQFAGEFTPDDAWQTYIFNVTQQPVAGYSSLRFQTDVFNPAAIGSSGDTRDLGFLLDQIRIKGE